MRSRRCADGLSSRSPEPSRDALVATHQSARRPAFLTTDAVRLTETQFLLELLIIALDPPAQFGQIDQPIKGDISAIPEGYRPRGAADPPRTAYPQLGTTDGRDQNLIASLKPHASVNL